MPKWGCGLTIDGSKVLLDLIMARIVMKISLVGVGLFEFSIEEKIWCFAFVHK
jgi:hypothetical protein